MPAIPVSGSYVGVESFRTASNLQATTLDSVIYEHVLGASREIERLTLRRFFPLTALAAYRWPPLHVGASWESWTEDDLLSVSSIQVAAAGQGAVPVALTHFFLEPQEHGPPYNRIEVDLSSSDVFQSGPTSQQSVQITGQWGYCNTTIAAGTLTGAINASVTSLVCSDGTLIDQGDVLLIDSEAIAVIPPRTWADPPNPTLTVQRGVNGTVAAAHSQNAPILKYQAPFDIRRIVRADAIGTFQQDQASWSRTVGAGEMAVEYQAKMQKSMRQTVVENYRRVKMAAV